MIPSWPDELQRLLQSCARARAGEFIDRLGLLPDNRGISPYPKFHSNPHVQDLYEETQRKVTDLTRLHTREELKTNLESNSFVEDISEPFLRKYGELLWGRASRKHLIVPDTSTYPLYPEDLFIDQGDHYDRIKVYLCCWIVNRVFRKLKLVEHEQYQEMVISKPRPTKSKKLVRCVSLSSDSSSDEETEGHARSVLSNTTRTSTSRELTQAKKSLLGLYLAPEAPAMVPGNERPPISPRNLVAGSPLNSTALKPVQFLQLPRKRQADTLGDDVHDSDGSNVHLNFPNAFGNDQSKELEPDSASDYENTLLQQRGPKRKKQHSQVRGKLKKVNIARSRATNTGLPSSTSPIDIYSVPVSPQETLSTAPQQLVCEDHVHRHSAQSFHGLPMVSEGDSRTFDDTELASPQRQRSPHATVCMAPDLSLPISTPHSTTSGSTANAAATADGDNIDSIIRSLEPTSAHMKQTRAEAMITFGECMMADDQRFTNTDELTSQLRDLWTMDEERLKAQFSNSFTTYKNSFDTWILMIDMVRKFQSSCKFTGRREALETYFSGPLSWKERWEALVSIGKLKRWSAMMENEGRSINADNLSMDLAAVVHELTAFAESRGAQDFVEPLLAFNKILVTWFT